MHFSKETVAAVWDEAAALLEKNNAETGLSGAEFSPSHARYRMLEDAGILRLFTIRATHLVGYSVFAVLPHPNYPRVVCATQDVTYVVPAHRGIRAVKFMQWCDRQLESEGVHIIVRQVDDRVDYSRTLERLGYQPKERSFLRRLNGT